MSCYFVDVLLAESRDCVGLHLVFAFRPIIQAVVYPKEDVADLVSSAVPVEVTHRPVESPLAYFNVTPEPGLVGVETGLGHVADRLKTVSARQSVPVKRVVTEVFRPVETLQTLAEPFFGIESSLLLLLPQLSHFVYSSL